MRDPEMRKLVHVADDEGNTGYVSRLALSED
jgi:hypothetical protein